MGASLASPPTSRKPRSLALRFQLLLQGARLRRPVKQSKLANMSTIGEIEDAVRRLSSTELAAFRAWFAEFDAARWDRQIEEDVAAGRLDALAEAGTGAHCASQLHLIPYHRPPNEVVKPPVGARPRPMPMALCGAGGD